MAGAMRKMAVYLGLVEDEDRYDPYDGYEHDRDEPVERPARGADPRAGAAGREELRARSSVATLPERRVAAAPAMAPSASDYRITTLHPRTYNDARTLGEEFRDGTPVIMNLTEMDDSDAKRLVDFAAGLVFGRRGTIERVTNKVFLLSPPNVHVTAEDKARIAENGFFNQS